MAGTNPTGDQRTPHLIAPLLVAPAPIAMALKTIPPNSALPFVRSGTVPGFEGSGVWAPLTSDLYDTTLTKAAAGQRID